MRTAEPVPGLSLTNETEFEGLVIFLSFGHHYTTRGTLGLCALEEQALERTAHQDSAHLHNPLFTHGTDLQTLSEP